MSGVEKMRPPSEKYIWRKTHRTRCMVFSRTVGLQPYPQKNTMEHNYEIAFVKIERGLILGQLTICSFTTKTEVNPEEHLRQAVRDWANTTEEGSELWKETLGTITISDLSGVLDENSLVPFGICDLDIVAFELPEIQMRLRTNLTILKSEEGIW